MADPDNTPGSEDDAWASIVANFGERVELPAEPTTWFAPFESDDHYVPPEAPHVGLAEGIHGAAWLGFIGAPIVSMLALLFNIGVPHWLGWLALIVFLASMGYLFTTMRHHDNDDPWDDGARV